MANKLDFDRLEMLEWLPKKGVCAELGVETGVYSKEIYGKNNPSKLYLIDSWIDLFTGKAGNTAEQQRQQNNFTSVCKMFEDKTNVEIIRKDLSQAVDDFDNETFDWIYLDAAHDYDNVIKDLNNWGPKVKSGGYICGHDWLKKPKIKRGVKFGVNEAVTEYVEKTGFDFVGVTSENNFMSFIIKK